MTPREFFALLRIRRWAEEREDYRMGKICEVVCAVIGAKNKDTGKPFTAQDFMPGRAVERPEVDVTAKALRFAQDFGLPVNPARGEGAVSPS